METVETKKESRIKNKTPDQLYKIAVDLKEGKIFTDKQISEHNSLEMVFMVVALGAFSEYTEEDIKDMGCIYEYMDKAGPRAVNGMPNFMSCQVMNRADWKKVMQFLKAIEDAEKETKAKLLGEECKTEKPAPTSGA